MSSQKRYATSRASQSVYQMSTRPLAMSRKSHIVSSGAGTRGGFRMSSGWSSGAGLLMSGGSSLMSGGSSLMSGGSSLMMGGGGLVGDEKNTMQNLNNRLATYLANVQRLEQSNQALEKEIREFGMSNIVEGFDWSAYDSTIKPLQKQILEAIMQNSHIALEIDNAKLAAEDFQNKWQTELMLRQSVENDIDGLHQLKDTYLQIQANLTNDISGLEDEIQFLKKNHEEDLRDLRQQKTQEVQVEVDSVQGVDLAAVMKELRDKYTNLTNNNQADMDKWYKEQLTIREMEISQNDQATVQLKAEITQLRRQYQNLEAERNGYCGNLAALENTLRSTEASYDSELQNYQVRLAQLEGELGSIRNELVSQNTKYQSLLNIKMQLEAEINHYKVLLEGGNQGLVIGGSSSSGFSSGLTSSGGGRTTIITTTETRGRIQN